MSTRLRMTPWFALLAVALPWGDALAQTISGGVPIVDATLRAPLDDATPDTLTTVPSGASRIGVGSSFSPDPNAADPNAPAAATPKPANKFALPKTPAKTADRVKVPRQGPPPLPPLQPYPTALRPRGGVPIIDAAPPTVAVLPVTPRVRTKVDDDPYAALGLRAGTLLVKPYVAESLGYDSNPDQTQTGVKPSAFNRTEGGLGLLSEWSSNELRADLRGGYNEYFSDSQANRPDANGTIDLRLDVMRDTIVDAEQRFSIDTQRPGSPGVNVNTVTRPLVINFGETLGVTETFGRASISLHGSLDRVAYDNAVLSNGAIEDLANENYDDYGMRLRGSYEITPVVKPFVDVLVDDRLHDATIDDGGYRRDSVGVIAQAGSSFEFDRLFSGELSTGYGRRDFDDSRLRALDGPVVNGSISYAVTPLTVVSLQAATTFDETTVAGASGSRSTSTTLSVAHQLLRNLTITGLITYLDTRYIGAPITETTLSETLKAEYHLSRSLVATASFNHQKLDSTSAGSSYDQNVVLFGLRLQR